jgi:hypothetical protein
LIPRLGLIGPRFRRVNGEQLAIAEWQRIPVETGVIRSRSSTRGGGSGFWRVIRHVEIVRINGGSAFHGDDLAAGVRAKFRRVGSVKPAGILGIFANVEETEDAVGVVRDGRVVELAQVRIVVEALVHVAQQLLAADVVERFLFSAVRVDLPRKELVERETVDSAAAAAGLRKDLRPHIELRQRPSGFTGKIESAVTKGSLTLDVVDVRIRLLIALQMVPPRKDNAAKRIDDGSEGTGR